MSAPRFFAVAMAIAAGVALPVSAYAQSASGSPLFAVMTGGNECNSAAPPSGPLCGLGDPDALGSATILLVPVSGASTTLCFGLTVSQLAGSTAAHIHRGYAGQNGPVVAVLAAPLDPGEGSPGTSSGCVSVSAETAALIRDDPTNFYVNVHSAAFPRGAVRGQLH